MSGDRAPRLIVVMGVAGCGKTTLGRALAGALDAPFIEGDAHHPASNIRKMAAAVPLTDDDRWPWLDEIGAALAAAASKRGTAIGACSALRRVYRARLATAAGRPVGFVCLAGDRAMIGTRLAARQGHFMPAALLDSQLATLEIPAPEENALLLDLALPVPLLVERTRTWLAETFATGARRHDEP